MHKVGAFGWGVRELTFVSYDWQVVSYSLKFLKRSHWREGLFAVCVLFECPVRTDVSDSQCSSQNSVLAVSMNLEPANCACGLVLP